MDGPGVTDSGNRGGGTRSPSAATSLPAPPPRALRLAIMGVAWPMRGGIAQYTAVLARELARRHQVDLISFKRQYPSLLFPGQTQVDTSEDPIRYPSEAIIDSMNPWSWLRAARRITAGSPDGLVFKYWMPFFAPAFGTIARKVKASGGQPRVIMLVDNLIPHERRFFDPVLTRYVMAATDAYIVQSGAVREDLLRLQPRARYLEVPHPVYLHFGSPGDKSEARRKLGIPGHEPLLLFFGFVRRYKGLDLLIRALPEVRRRFAETGRSGPPPRLLVLGEFYEGRAQIDRLVLDLGLEGAVDLRDAYVPDELVGRYFSAADVVVLPYRSATQSGIVQVAYQLERPVICTNVGGLSEVVVDGTTGLVVPPEDPGALAEAILRYYREGLEDDFVAAIRRERGKYSWDRMVEAVETLVAEPDSSRSG